MSHYYAYHNSYGNSTRDSRNRRIGFVAVFDSKAERDAWVAEEDYYGGNAHREAIGSHEARSYMLDELYAELVFDPVFDAPTMDEVVDAYQAICEEH